MPPQQQHADISQALEFAIEGNARPGSHMIAVYASYAGVIAERIVIDSDQWRRAFLLFGATRGLFATSRTYAARATSSGESASTVLWEGSPALAPHRSPA